MTLKLHIMTHFDTVFLGNQFLFLVADVWFSAGWNERSRKRFSYTWLGVWVRVCGGSKVTWHFRVQLFLLPSATLDGRLGMAPSCVREFKFFKIARRPFMKEMWCIKFLHKRYFPCRNYALPLPLQLNIAKCGSSQIYTWLLIWGAGDGAISDWWNTGLDPRVIIQCQ